MAKERNDIMGDKVSQLGHKTFLYTLPIEKIWISLNHQSQYVFFCDDLISTA